MFKVLFFVVLFPLVLWATYKVARRFWNEADVRDKLEDVKSAARKSELAQTVDTKKVADNRKVNEDFNKLKV